MYYTVESGRAGSDADNEFTLRDSAKVRRYVQGFMDALRAVYGEEAGVWVDRPQRDLLSHGVTNILCENGAIDGEPVAWVRVTVETEEEYNRLP